MRNFRKLFFNHYLLIFLQEKRHFHKFAHDKAPYPPAFDFGQNAGNKKNDEITNLL